MSNSSFSIDIAYHMFHVVCLIRRSLLLVLWELTRAPRTAACVCSVLRRSTATIRTAPRSLGRALLGPIVQGLPRIRTAISVLSEPSAAGIACLLKASAKLVREVSIATALD